MVVTLSAAANRLRDADAEHRSKFSGQHLVGLLDSDTGYALEKIAVGTRRMALGECDPSDEAMARAGLDVLARIANTVRFALRERGEFPEVHAPLDYLLAEVTNAGATLEEVFAGHVDARHGQAYAHLLGIRLKELREVLAEVDAEYQAESAQIVG